MKLDDRMTDVQHEARCQQGDWIKLFWLLHYEERRRDYVLMQINQDLIYTAVYFDR